MSVKWRLGVLTGALVLVELASFWKLAHWLTWTNESWLAYTSALAFISLLLASIIALGSNIPDSTRRQFYIAGIWLFTIQGLANVLIAYNYGLTLLPVDVVTRFFGVGAEEALKSMAMVQGASLSLVSISFWSVISQILREQWEHRRSQREQLRLLDQFLQESSNEPV